MSKILKALLTIYMGATMQLNAAIDSNRVRNIFQKINKPKVECLEPVLSGPTIDDAVESNMYLAYFWNEKSHWKRKSVTHVGLLYLDDENEIRLLNSAYSKSRGKEVQHLDYIKRVLDENTNKYRYMIVRNNKVISRYHFKGIVKRPIEESNLTYFLYRMKEAQIKGYPKQYTKMPWGKYKRGLKYNCALIAREYPRYNCPKVLKRALQNAGKKFIPDTDWITNGDTWTKYREFKNQGLVKFDFDPMRKSFRKAKSKFYNSSVWQYVCQKKKWNKFMYVRK